jgi:ERF superfamily
MAAEQLKQELVTKADVIPIQNSPPTLMAYLKAAESGADLERLEKLMDLHERHERNEARKAFDDAMASFRSEQMVILKTKFVDISGGAKFHHAQLADVCEAVIGNMSKYGLRHRWRTEQPSGNVKVTCIISHRLGHSEGTELESKPDTGGNKSPIHAVASAVALLERYTLLAAVGLAAKDMDNDPRGTGSIDPNAKPEPADFKLWKEDAQARAKQGSDELQKLWKSTPEDIRAYVVLFEKSFWDDQKAIAGKVTRAAKAAS